MAADFEPVMMTGSPTTNNTDCHWWLAKVAPYDMLGEHLRNANPVKHGFISLSLLALIVITWGLTYYCKTPLFFLSLLNIYIGMAISEYRIQKDPNP